MAEKSREASTESEAQSASWRTKASCNPAASLEEVTSGEKSPKPNKKSSMILLKIFWGHHIMPRF